MEKNPTVVFEGPRKVVIEDRKTPVPKAGELLIRTRKTLISTGTELTVLSGEFPPGSVWDRAVQFPMVVGYCNVGDVIQVGPGGDERWVGKRVVSPGFHSLYVKVPSQAAVLIDRDTVSDEEATFSTMAVIAANGVRRAGLTWGEAVVVYGLGLLGQFAVRFSRLCGARPAISLPASFSPAGLAGK